MKLKATEFIALVLTALVTGVFWGTWFTLTRSLDNFAPAEFIKIGKTIIANVALPMRILLPATLLFILLAVLQSRRVNKQSFYFYTVSFVLMIVTFIITIGVEVPIDKQIETWTIDTLPQNWESLRHTWDKFHTLRTISSISSFCFLAAGIIYRAGK